MFSVPVPKKSLAFLFLVTVALPVAIVLMTGGAGWTVFGLVVAVSLAVAGGTWLVIRSAKVRVEDDGVRLTSLLYSAAIPRKAIERMAFYDRLPEHLEARLRSNGIGLPGFALGHFRLKNGGKAFLMCSVPPYAVIDTGEKVYIFSVDGVVR